jgi:flagellar hook-length control protein FliK
MIKEVLLKDISKNIKTPKFQENFLLSLLKENPKELKTFLKELKIPKEEIIKLIKKEPPKIQEKLLKNLQELDFTPVLNDLPVINDSSILNDSHIKPNSKSSKNDSTLKPPDTLIQNETKQPLFQNVLKKTDEKTVVKIIKKELLSKEAIKNFKFTQEEIKTIKTASSLKELITFANKKGLNITKVIVKNINPKQPIHPMPTNLKPKINPQKILKTPDTPKQKNHTPNKTQQTDILSQLFLSKNKTTKNTNKPKTPKPNTGFLHTQTTIQNTKPQKENTQITLSTLLSDTPEKLKKTKKPENKQILNQTYSLQPDLKPKIIQAKTTLKHFTTNLQKAIEDYKPPVSKVSLELHPKELGKVEITLLHRGENLQIHINSASSTINFFNAHQNELKNMLINMGYSEVNMSFNSNQQQQQKQQYRQNQNTFSKEEDEFVIEIPYTYA